MEVVQRAARLAGDTVTAMVVSATPSVFDSRVWTGVKPESHPFCCVTL